MIISQATLTSINGIVVKENITNDIFKNVNDILGRITDAIKNVISEEQIELLGKWLEKIIDNSKYEQIMDILIVRVKDMLNFEKTKYTNECIKINIANISSIALNQQQKTINCVKDAQIRLKILKSDLLNLKVELINIFIDTGKKINRCILEADKYECLNNIFKENKTLADKAKALIAYAQNVVSENEKCTKQVQKESDTELKDIVRDIADCSSYSILHILIYFTVFALACRILFC